MQVLEVQEDGEYPSTSSLVSITVSNSPNPSRVYIRLCKHGKRFLLLKCMTAAVFSKHWGTSLLLCQLRWKAFFK